MSNGLGVITQEGAPHVRGGIRGAHGHGVRLRVVRWHVGCGILPMEAGEDKYPSTAVMVEIVLLHAFSNKQE